jgi:hypothetical protein
MVQAVLHQPGVLTTISNFKYGEALIFLMENLPIWMRCVSSRSAVAMNAGCVIMSWNSSIIRAGIRRSGAMIRTVMAKSTVVGCMEIERSFDRPTGCTSTYIPSRHSPVRYRTSITQSYATSITRLKTEGGTQPTARTYAVMVITAPRANSAPGPITASSSSTILKSTRQNSAPTSLIT